MTDVTAVVIRDQGHVARAPPDVTNLVLVIPQLARLPFSIFLPFFAVKVFALPETLGVNRFLLRNAKKNCLTTASFTITSLQNMLNTS